MSAELAKFFADNIANMKAGKPYFTKDGLVDPKKPNQPPVDLRPLKAAVDRVAPAVPAAVRPFADPQLVAAADAKRAQVIATLQKADAARRGVFGGDTMKILLPSVAAVALGFLIRKLRGKRK